MKIYGSFRRVLVVLVFLAVVGSAAWWWMIRMPGKNVTSAGTLSASEMQLRAELVADVQMLGGEIGERNLQHYAKLQATVDFLEKSLTRAGLTPVRQSYDVNDLACHNIEVEIAGDTREIVLVGAHYDSVFGAPGANDNGSGVAATLALARRFAGRHFARTLRFVFFVNEEPPYFQTQRMGSLVYAGRCKARAEKIAAMISLETIGYFSDSPNSQIYPVPAIGAFYPRKGNFIGFVGNVASRTLLQRAISVFREQGKLPSEGAALPSFVPGIGWSDQWAFWQNGYPAIMVTDTAPFRYPYYHDVTDTPEKLDYDRFALVVSGMSAVIENLAGSVR